MPAVRLSAVSRRKGLPTTRRQRSRLQTRLRREVADDMLVSARASCPVRTGRLRASIGGEAVVKSSAYLRLWATAPYASYVEYGTSRQGARPFLGPAWEQAAPRFRRVIGQFISEIQRERAKDRRA